VAELPGTRRDCGGDRARTCSWRTWWR